MGSESYKKNYALYLRFVASSTNKTQNLILITQNLEKSLLAQQVGQTHELVILIQMFVFFETFGKFFEQ